MVDYPRLLVYVNWWPLEFVIVLFYAYFWRFQGCNTNNITVRNSVQNTHKCLKINICMLSFKHCYICIYCNIHILTPKIDYTCIRVQCLKQNIHILIFNIHIYTEKWSIFRCSLYNTIVLCWCSVCLYIVFLSWDCYLWLTFHAL